MKEVSVTNRLSGLVSLLQPGDLVIADTGFLIKDILQ